MKRSTMPVLNSRQIRSQETRAAIVSAAGLIGVRLIWHGRSTADEPTYVETVVARTARHLAIPHEARAEKNPLSPTVDVLKEAGEKIGRASCRERV